MAPDRSTDRRPVSHVRPVARHRVSRTRRGELGYTMIMTALLLVPMMVVAGFGVDVGAWYTRAAELQRAADAAVLAGVVWMPGDFDRAEDEARAVATRNGVEHGVNGITVEVEEVPGRSNELDVIVTDPNVPAYMATVVMGGIDITRSARGRYVLPVPLGSPLNTFGNQGWPLPSGSPQLWGAINAPYTGHAQGDPYATKCGGEPNGIASCPSPNEDYRPEGYRYIIDVPPGAEGKTLTVEIFDAPFVERTSAGTETGDSFNPCWYQWNWKAYYPYCNYSRTRGPALQYELFEADETPLDVTDNPSMRPGGGATVSCSSGPGRLILGNNHAGTRHEWTRLCRATVQKAGQYVLQVKSSDIQGTTDQGGATAQYSLRASLSSGPQPSLYASGDMSILTNVAGSQATMYLAEVVPIHAGKTFQIELFDPGDGSDTSNYYLSILKPDGSTAQCSYSDSSGDMGDETTCRITTRSSGTNLYNDKWLSIDVRLGSDYTCDETSTTGCWWKVKYELGTTPTDRTTWRANILGDPVQLVR